jgi:signal peptidase I
MEPTFREGDWLLARRTSGTPGVGAIVIANDPREPARLVVKRVRSITGDAVSIEGDHRDGSTDSRDYGPIPSGSIVGQPVLRYAPLRRFGRVR